MDSQLRMLAQVKLSKIGHCCVFVTGKMIHMQKFDHGIFVNALLCFFYRIIASSALYC